MPADISSALNLLSMQSDSVTAGLPDFYRFTLAGRSSVNLTLNGLSGNADLQLLDGSGSVIPLPLNQGTLAESINQVLEAGTYYLQVSLGAGSASANYSLGFQAQNNPYTGIVWRNYAGGQESIWQIDGNGTILNNAGFASAPINWQIEATGDFNGDGQQDLVFRDRVSGDVRIWVMDGVVLSSISPSLGAAADPWEIRGAGDFNSDGKTDLVWRNKNSGQNVIWLLNTASGTTLATTLTQIVSLPDVTDPSWQIQGVGDFNRDGKNDLVWRNQSSGQNVVWIMDTTPNTTWTTTLAGIAWLPAVTDLNWQLQGVGDFNRDGRPDLLWRNMSMGQSGSGQNFVWTMAGTNGTDIASTFFVSSIEDSNWRAVAPLLGFNAPTPIDVAGNIQGTAFNIGTLNGYGTYRDTVSNSDPDFYQFTLLQGGRINLGVYGGVDATLVGYGGFTQDPISGKRLSPLLAPGTYSIQVYAASSFSTGYALELGIPVPATPSLLQLAPASDSGVSASDRITKVKTPTITGRAEAFTTIQVLNGAQLLGTTAANSNGDWQFTTGVLADGSNSLTARAVSAAGSTSATSAALALTIDSVAPQFTLTTPLPTQLTAQSRLTGTVNGMGSGVSSLQYRFDSLPLVSVALSQTGTFDQLIDSSGLRSGTYSLTLVATDVAGNTVTSTPASVVVPSPTVPTQLGLNATSDSGISQTDRITKITTPVVTGLAAANAKVLLFNGTTKLGEALADGTGRWEITSSLVLAAGTYNLTARALSATGDASADSAALSIVIDTQTATPTLLTPEFAPGNAAIVRGSAEAGALVQVFEGTQLLGTATANATGSWQLTSPAFEIGTYYFSAIATDIAGNVSPKSLVTSWVVPAAVLAAPQGLRLTAATDSGQSQTDNITSNLSPTIAGMAPVGTTVRLFRNQQFLGQAPTDATGAWSLALTSPLPAGTYALTAIATSAGGSSPAASLMVTIDPLVPTAQVNVLADGSTTPAALANGAVLATGMRLVGQADGTLSAIAALKYKLGANPEVEIAVSPEGLFNQLLDLTGVSGSQSLVITATDGAGNLLPAQSYSVTVNPLPVNGLVLLAQLSQDTGSDATDGWTSTPGVSGRLLSAQSPVTGLWGRFEGGTTSGLLDLSAALSPDGSFVLSADQLAALAGETLADGAYTLILEGRTAANQTVERRVSFSLDTAAPELFLTSVEDGTAWERGTALRGEVKEPNRVALSYQIVRESDGGTVAQNSLTVQTSGTGATFDQVPLELTAGNKALTEEEPYNLVLTSTDRAGNSQRSSFQFFVLSERLVEDDDLLVDETGTPRVNPPDPVVSGGGSVTTSGTYGGGGVYGYNGYSSGGIGTFTPVYRSLDPAPLPVNPTTPPTGNAYEYEYVESISKIVDKAVDFISTAPQTLNEKAALKNRANILSALGSRLNTLILPDGYKETKDKALIQQMSPVMAGLFVNAYDPAHEKSGIWSTTVDGYGEGLARSLVDDSLVNQVSVREQVFRATLMEVVTEVFWTKNIAMTATELAALAATVKELAKTYAWLNPKEEATVPVDQTDYGWLDRLWQLQVPQLVLRGGKRVSEFKSAAVIQTDLQKAVEAVGRLLAGVNEPLKAIQFLSGLVQAETDVPSLKSSFKDAQFWRESVELGMKVAKLNPVTTDVTAADAAGTFLNTLWKQGNTTAAQAGLGQFFGGLKTTSERVKSLEFADRLIDAAQLTTGLGAQKTDAKFLSQLVGLGGSYAALKPTVTSSQSGPLNFFLDTLYRGATTADIGKGSLELGQYLGYFENFNDGLKSLDYTRKVYATLEMAKNSFNGYAGDTTLLAALSVLGGHYTATFNPLGNQVQSKSFFANAWSSQSSSGLKNIANALSDAAGTLYASTTGGGSTISSSQNVLKAIFKVDQRSDIVITFTGGRVPGVQSLQPSATDSWQDANPATWPQLPSDYQFSINVISSKKALIINPYGSSRGGLPALPGGIIEADNIKNILDQLKQSGDITEVEVLENRDNNFNFSIQDLLDRDLSDYGVIAFISHGDIYLNGGFVSSSNSSVSSAGEVVLNTNEILTPGSILQYMKNLIRRELVIGKAGNGQVEFALTPKFIRANSSNQNSNAIVYLGTCFSMFNNSMAQAFQDIGAGSVLGYNRSVGDQWAQRHGTAMFRALSTGRKVGETPGLFEVEESASQARFVIAGGLSFTLVDKS